MVGDPFSWRPRRVLVGYDGTVGGDDGLALATAIAEPGAEFLLVDVIPPVGIFTMRPRRLEDGEPPQSAGFFCEALERMSGRTVETRSYVANSAARVLSEVAEEEDYDIVVIGACYPGVVGRVLIGSVGEGLMHGAVVPVVAAPRSYAERPPKALKQIAVAWDASPEAHEALAHAQVMARQTGGEIHLLYVSPPESFAAKVGDLTRPSPDRVLAEGFAAVAPDIPIDGSSLEGREIASTISVTCAERGVDLLVVGSRGYGMLGRVIVGSVATGLLHGAPCPVLTVPRPHSGEGSDDTDRRTASTVTSRWARRPDACPPTTGVLADRRRRSRLGDRR